MVYEVPKSKASIKQNRFEFKLEGKVYSVPLLKYLPVRVAELMEQGGMAGVLAAFGDGDAAEAVRGLDGEQLEGLTEAWAEASEVKPGE